MEFVTGVLMLGVGLWLIKRITTGSNANTDCDVQAEVKRLKNLQSKALEAQEIAIQTQTKVLEQSRLFDEFVELRQQVADDALKRETRSKAALISVLKSNGATDEQIQGVLEKIDSPEK